MLPTAISLHPSGEIGSDFEGASPKSPQEMTSRNSVPHIVFESASLLLIVAIAFTGIYPSRETEKN